MVRYSMGLGVGSSTRKRGLVLYFEINVLTHRKNQFHTIKFKKHTIQVQKTHKPETLSKLKD